MHRTLVLGIAPTSSTSGRCRGVSLLALALATPAWGQTGSSDVLARRASASGSLPTTAAGTSAEDTAVPAPADPTTSGQADASAGAVGEIVVTAQKRSERVNAVPMSISAASGAMLRDQGISQVADLQKVVPGLTYVQSGFATPVYSIRGVGFYETSLASTPAVTVYTDEIPLPYPQMTRNAGLDVERVEVLKGPQGTLFGQNATGGAINYIAAKPTRSYQSGADISFGRFATLDASGFLSGPVSDSISARIALRTVQGGDWQRSYTRGDMRGQKNILQGRLLLDWKPSPRWRSELSIGGWVDKSDTQAPQLVARTPTIPALADPRFLTYPLAPRSDRAADWTPGYRQAADDKFYQLSLRNEYEFSDAVTLTSITAYSHIAVDSPVDADGTALQLYQRDEIGSVSSFSQELRASGTIRGIRWIVGGNYGDDRTRETDEVLAPDAVVARLFGPSFSASHFKFIANDRITTRAVFGNADIPVTARITLHGGLRYTRNTNHFEGCTAGYPDNDPRNIGPAFQALLNGTRASFGAPPVTIPNGGCVTFDTTLTPGLVSRELDQDNVSWRAGIDWTLVYANVSKGYKAGTFASVGATLASQYDPARQEALLAYEGGFKLTLVDHKVQLNGAVFYYDYTDKQLRGSVQDPIFGSLDKLLNVPKSHIVGGELTAQLRPVTGLTLNAGATYVKSEVDGSYVNYTPYGTPADFRGESFPYTPRWQGSVDGQYETRVSDRLGLFFGGNVQIQGKTSTAFGGLPIFHIPSYALVDLRAGVKSNGDKWRAWLWGRNVLDKFYYTSLAFLPTDATVRYAGQPATYGVSLSLRY